MNFKDNDSMGKDEIGGIDFMARYDGKNRESCCKLSNGDEESAKPRKGLTQI